MAHYALLDENNIVVSVITGRNEDEIVDGISYDWEEYYSEATGYKALRTSYNTFGGQHLSGGTPFRKNYATVGGYYDPVRDAFCRQQDFPSWTLNEDTCWWEPPIPNPNPGWMKWDEATLSWVEI